jgi:hypothetical protein
MELQIEELKGQNMQSAKGRAARQKCEKNSMLLNDH